MTRLVVARSDPAAITVDDTASRPLDDGDVRLSVERFGLTSNNISYALFGDALGYWAHFPVDDAHGCIPVWGFAEVAASHDSELAVGERVFGYLPMATELIVRPSDVDPRSFTDSIAHRAELHPWYRRFHRCGADPVWTPETEDVQVPMWALFMTGWALADELAESATSVVLSSASSKTALSLAWSLRAANADVRAVGLTSGTNRSFVERSGVFDTVVTYDDIALADVEGPAAYVDAAGSPGITERVHAALGDRLTDSVVLGATHQGAGAAQGDLVGPAPRFFFIPDVAEQAAANSRSDFHGRFATAWHEFVPWISGRLHIEPGSGVDAVIAGYRTILAGGVGPDTAKVFTW